MHSYTREQEEKMCRISPDDDDYIEELLEAVKGFRSFGKAMEAFLRSRGYHGDSDSRDEKAAYIGAKFRQSGIMAPRNMKKWFQEPVGGLSGAFAKIGRDTAFQICFAFQLDAKETEDFFRRIYRTRAFDLHNAKELIYYYGLSHGMRYEEVRQMIEQTEEAEEKIAEGGLAAENAGNGGGENPGNNAVRYTASIAEEAKKFNNKDELIIFIREHREDFRYSNVTAYHYIHTLWEKIAGRDGLAAQEKKRLYQPFDAEGDGGTEGCGAETESGQGISQRQRRPARSGSDSLWEIYLQILGLAGTNVKRLGTDRSLKPVLKDNELMHALAEDCFPDRDGLNKIVNGVTVSYEKIRKTMILLVFYEFWVKRALQNGDYEAGSKDGDRCFARINEFLTDAGYPALYAGNPFDWIFMHVLVDDYPLMTFRDYMRELFFRKDGQGKDK